MFAHTHTHLKKEMFSASLIFPCLLAHPKNHDETSMSISMWHCQSSLKMVEVESWKYRFLSASEFLSFASRVPFGSLVAAVFYRNWSNQMRLYNWIILTTKPPAPWRVKGSLGWWANLFQTKISESSRKNKSNQWENWFGHSWRYMFLLERSFQCRIGQHGVASCFPWLPSFTVRTYQIFGLVKISSNTRKPLCFNLSTHTFSFSERWAFSVVLALSNLGSSWFNKSPGRHATKDPTW